MTMAGKRISKMSAAERQNTLRWDSRWREGGGNSWSSCNCAFYETRQIRKSTSRALAMTVLPMNSSLSTKS